MKPRTIKYTTYWPYIGPGEKRQGRLANRVLAIPYLMDETLVIPPLAVLNQVLESGSNNGGMSPGTTWRPFRISADEYDDLVSELQTLKGATIDPDLANCVDELEWLTERRLKYHPDLQSPKPPH